MIVSLEEFLDAGAFELCLILKHLLGVSVFPLTVSVLRIEVIFVLGWLERRSHAFLAQCIPIEVCEPFMLLDDMWTFFSQSVGRLTLDEFVD